MDDKMGNESLEESKTQNIEKYIHKTIKEVSIIIILILLPVILFFASFLVGRYPVSPTDVLMALLPIKTNLSPAIYAVVWNIRLPRIIAAMIVGAALSISGASFQGTFQNPLVSPDILGVSSGAGFGAALAILLSSSPFTIQISAFICGMIAVSLTYFLSRSFRGNATLMMVLGGIAIGALFSAFLGYNPVDAILSALPPTIVAAIPKSTLSTLTGNTWFPSTLANAFLPSLRISFYIGAAFCGIAAILSALRGEKYIHEHEGPKANSNEQEKIQTEN